MTKNVSVAKKSGARCLNFEVLDERRLLSASPVVNEFEILTPHATIPRFAAHAEFVAVQNGAWSDPSIWNLNRVPGESAKVLIPDGIELAYDLASTAKLDAVEINGRLDFRTDINTSLWINEITVMPDGVLTIGTAENPVAATATSQIVFTDTPQADGLHFKTGTLEAPGIDPEQYGNGLLAFGTVVMHGQALNSTYVRLQGDALAGSTTITTQQDVSGWRVGDEIVIPDTRHTNPVSRDPYYEYVPQWETRIVVGVSGNELTLDQALEFDHLGPRDADGSRTLDFDLSQLAAHVGNLTRNVVLRSENPQGVRGHVLFTGNSYRDIRYVGFEELGRTLAEALNNTTYDANGQLTHVGTNQVGRYSDHNHHLMGPAGGIQVDGNSYQWVSIGNVVSGAKKWGTTIHGTHFGILSDNVYYDTDGAAVAAEDGSEYGNRIEHNFVVRVNGGTQSFNGLGENTNDLGDQGDGFWFAGPLNEIRDNTVANAYRNGYVFWPDGVPHTRGSAKYRDVQIPTEPGSHMATRTVNLLEQAVTDFVGNEVYGATTGGVQVWSVGNRYYFPDAPDRNTLTDTTVWHVTGVGIRFYYADSYVVDGWIQRGDPGMIERGVKDGGQSRPSIGAAIVHAGSTARESLVRRANVQNMTVGYFNRGRGRADEITLVDSYFDNHFNMLNIPWTQSPPDGSRDFLLQNVRFGDAANLGASNAIDMQWRPSSEYSALASETFTVRDHDGVSGLNLQIYYAEQAPGEIAKLVPSGLAPAGRFAPTQEVDGDNGYAAKLRGKALGISGLVFEELPYAGPQLFFNIEPTFDKPRLFYAVLGEKSQIAGVRFQLADQTFELSELAGELDLAFLSQTGLHAILGEAIDAQGAVLAQADRVLQLPLRTKPGVRSVNRAPQLDTIHDRENVAGQTIAFQLHAIDPEDDNVLFEAIKAPVTATFDQDTGQFLWETTNRDAGTHVLEFRATDSFGNHSLVQRVKIEVTFDYSFSTTVASLPLTAIDLDDTTRDHSVYAHGATLLGSPSVTSHGMLFNGSGDAVLLEQSEAFHITEALTVAVDVSPNGSNHLTRLVGFDSGSRSAYQLSVKDSGSMRDARGLLQGYWFTVTTETGVHSVSLRNNQWSFNKWNHVVGVFDGSREGGYLAIYVDGTLRDELAGIGTRIVYPPNGGQRITIGGDPFGGRSFGGQLANVKIDAAAFAPDLTPRVTSGLVHAPMLLSDTDQRQQRYVPNDKILYTTGPSAPRVSLSPVGGPAAFATRQPVSNLPAMTLITGRAHSVATTDAAFTDWLRDDLSLTTEDFEA